MDYFKIFIAFLGTVFTWIFGAWDTALCVLIIFMVCDYATGLIKAYINKQLSSNVGLHGLARKGIVFIVLIVSVALDRLLNDETWVFRTITCYFYIANESISIMENCGECGLPIPTKLKNALIQLKSKEE